MRLADQRARKGEHPPRAKHRFAWGERPPRCGGPEIPASAKKKPTHQNWLFLKMARPEG
jgi:hypothetical protein